MFSTIISAKNLEGAYLDLVEKFAEDGKEFTYHGIDNYTLLDYDFDSLELLSRVRDELIEKKPLDPALLLHIPKKHNPAKTRDIFVYTLKERVKAQALYRVVVPLFEHYFSNRLFSYRPGRPPSIAAYLFARRYRRYHKTDHCLVVDLQNYSNLLDTTILFEQLKNVIPDSRVRDLLRLFIVNPLYEQGVIRSMDQGVVQGVPLIALFANLYLTDLDYRYQKMVSFYIRVGDDLVLADQNSDTIARVGEQLKEDLHVRGLELNHDKWYRGPARGDFSFLGYRFSAGRIRLEDGYVRSMVRTWNRLLVDKHKTKSQKYALLVRIMRHPTRNFTNQFEEMVRSKPQLNDSEQIKVLSERFFAILTEFYFVRYTPRNRRLLTRVIRDLGIQSLYHVYTRFHYERS